MGITQYDISILDEIMSGEGTWFTAHLLRLMGKADLDNLARLAEGFPKEFVEFAMWKWGGVPSSFAYVHDVNLLMRDDALSAKRYRWYNPENGQEVKVTLTHGRDF